MPLPFLSSAWNALSAPYYSSSLSHSPSTPDTSTRLGDKSDTAANANAISIREPRVPGSWNEDDLGSEDGVEEEQSTPRASPVALPPPIVLAPPSIEIEEPPSVEDEWMTDDSPPAFPALNSIQRSGRAESETSLGSESSTSSARVSSPSLILPTSNSAAVARTDGPRLSSVPQTGTDSLSRSEQDALRMPPPPFLPNPRFKLPPPSTSTVSSGLPLPEPSLSAAFSPSLSSSAPSLIPPNLRIPSASGNISPMAPSSSSTGSRLSPRPTYDFSANSASSTTFASTSVNSGVDSASLLSPLVTSKVPPNTNTKKKARAKVALTPGHSPLDWARLKSSGQDLRAGITQLIRITPSELKLHNARDDAWSAFGGKVYNITPYLPFHPGGEKELMRVAGRDGTKLFALTHSWVNLDYMLDGCMVGFLVSESSAS